MRPVPPRPWLSGQPVPMSLPTGDRPPWRGHCWALSLTRAKRTLVALALAFIWTSEHTHFKSHAGRVTCF